MSEIEDDDSWTQAFAGSYAKSRAGLEERSKAERQAGKTEKQRERARKPKKKQFNVRASAHTRALVDQLCTHLDVSQADVIELAIAELAARRLGKEGA
jgi:hypothetical protein